MVGPPKAPEPAPAPPPPLPGEPVDDLDAGQVALVDGAVKSLSRKGLLVNGAVGIAIEEAAERVLELAHARGRIVHQETGKILVVQPAAALDGIHEMAFDAVAGSERDVVAALHHAGAAAFPEQTFDRDGDVEIGIGLLGMERGEKAGAAGPEDQDVGVELLETGTHAPRPRCYPPLEGEGRPPKLAKRA